MQLSLYKKYSLEKTKIEKKKLNVEFEKIKERGEAVWRKWKERFELRENSVVEVQKMYWIRKIILHSLPQLSSELIFLYTRIEN